MSERERIKRDFEEKAGSIDPGRIGEIFAPGLPSLGCPKCGGNVEAVDGPEGASQWRCKGCGATYPIKVDPKHADSVTIRPVVRPRDPVDVRTFVSLMGPPPPFVILADSAISLEVHQAISAAWDLAANSGRPVVLEVPHLQLLQWDGSKYVPVSKKGMGGEGGGPSTEHCLARIEVLIEDLAEARQEIERLREDARKWYGPGGTYMVLDSPEEVVNRRIEAAAELHRLRAMQADPTSKEGVGWGPK
jgi:hypothetical protein